MATINPKARPCDEAAIRSTPATGNCAASAKPWVLLVTILASSIAYIDESVVNVALPAIEADLAASVAVIQWLVNAYVLCLSAFLLTGGAAGDLFGRRRVLVLGLVIFAVASLWCGFAPDVGQLIAARAIQGAGAALLVPCSLALIGANFDEAERGKAIGTWAGFSAIAAAIGPLTGGWIVDHFSWRFIFLINPVLALPTLWIALDKVPESRATQAAGGLDWLGALLAFGGLGGLAFGLIAAPLSGWSDASVLSALVLGAAVLLVFVWWEGRSRTPMLPLALFRSRTFSAVNLLTLLLYAALGGVFFFLPFALIQVQGFSASLAGAAMVPFTVIMAGLSRWAGGLADRFGAKGPLGIGAAIAALGFALLALAVGGSSYVAYLVAITVQGLGMVVVVAPLTTTVINAVAENQTGIAAAINNAVASVASLLAVAMLGALALGLYDRALDRNLAAGSLSAEVRHAVVVARGQFVTAPALATAQGGDRQAAETIIRQSLAGSIRSVLLVCAALALVGAASSLLLPGSPSKPPAREPIAPRSAP
jgi:EmrB/QacA subfamily drug resistance transporter